MNTRPTMAVLVGVAILLGLAGTVQASILGPYTADADTLHLWHLDEGHPGPALPAAGIAGSFNLTPVNGATLGHGSFTGFGSAGYTTTAANGDDGLQGDNIPVSAVTGANGAFTLEAIVRPSTITGSNQQIVCMEAPGGNAGRPFQFRINTDGRLEFINIAPGIQNLIAPIPTTGGDAFVADQWFHAAATYNGNAGTADNFKLYWTALDPARTQASQIFSGTMNSDLAASAVLGVGNEFRSPSENMRGLIDEVRISGVPRAATDFLFGPGSGGGPAPAPAVIYADSFDGLSSSDLHGTAPDVRPNNQTWTANSLWKADGSKTANGNANAWLPFAPQAGKIYALTLEANPDASTSNDWFAIGFSDGNATTNWHTNAANQIFGWMLNRENDASASVIQTFLGPDTTDAAGFDLNPDIVGPVELQVVLNTMDAAWTLEWLVDGQSLRGPVAFGTNPPISQVGFGAWNTATGLVGNFTLADLTAEPIPEPATLSLLGLGGLLALRRRRRSR